MIDKNVPK